ncbi:MAG: leucine-rich repeat protein, partial [Spirochaetales bacterium]|nr:leucine-rich repeat protein [Spirochaetales bacterium]
SVFKMNTDKGNIKTIDIQADVESIDANAFQGSSKLEEVILPSGENLKLNSIGAYAFQGCGNLYKIPFPSSLTSIGDYAFSGTKLPELRSDNIKTIGVGAFSNSKVKEVRLGAVETIGENAFQNCGSLQSVWLPSTLSSSSIGSKAFDGCNNIKNVGSKIASPSDIGGDVFSVTSSQIATLFVPSEDYDSYTIGAWKNKFANIVKGEFIAEDTQNKFTYSLYEIAGATEGAGTLAAILTKSSSSDTEVKITSPINVLASGDSESKSYEVREIGAYSFQNSTSLNKVWLPKTLTSIGDYAFDGCGDIKEIVSDIEDVFKISSNVFSVDITPTAQVYIPDGSYDDYTTADISGGWSDFKKFESGKWLETENPVDDYMKYRYHTSQHIATLIGVNPTGSLETLPIPNEVTIDNVKYTVTAIGSSVFKMNTDKGNIKTIDIQADVESIGANAFQGSSKLTTLRLPSNLKSIGDNAFQGCTNLQYLWLPEDLSSIGNKAFDGCNLTRVTCKALPEITRDVFSAYKNAYLFVPQGVTIKDRIGWGEFSRIYEGYYEGEKTSNDDQKFYIYLSHDDGSRTAILTKYENSDKIKSPVKFNNEDYVVTIISESACSGVTLDNLELP